MKIFVIIVTYNGEKFIYKCLNSVYNSSVKTEVIVIDNASQDKTVEIIEKKYPKVQLIKNKKNLGFAKANNIGLKIALREEADYVVLLNQDAEILPDSIEKLVKIAKEIPEAGIISPLQINKYNQPSRLIYHWLLKTNPTFFDDAIEQKLKKYYEIAFISASFWLLPRQTILKVGGFNPVFFMYGEDGEYSNRVKNKKLKIILVPETKYIHHKYNLYKKTFSKQILEVRNYFIEHSTNFNYTFLQNFKSSFRYIYTEMIKYLFLFKLKLTAAYFIGILYFLFSLPLIIKILKDEKKDQPTFLK